MKAPTSSSSSPPSTTNIMLTIPKKMTISVDIDELLCSIIADSFSEHEAQDLEPELQNLKTLSLSISLSHSKFPPLRTHKHQQQWRKTRQSLFDPPVANRMQPLLPNPSGEANESTAAVAKTTMTRGQAHLAEAVEWAAVDCAVLWLRAERRRKTPELSFHGVAERRREKRKGSFFNFLTVGPSECHLSPTEWPNA